IPYIGAKFGSATTTSWPSSSRHLATHSLSVDASRRIFACARPPSTSVNLPRSVWIRFSMTSPFSVTMYSWLCLLCTSMPICSTAGLHLRHLTVLFCLWGFGYHVCGRPAASFHLTWWWVGAKSCLGTRVKESKAVIAEVFISVSPPFHELCFVVEAF